MKAKKEVKKPMSQKASKLPKDKTIKIHIKKEEAGKPLVFEGGIIESDSSTPASEIEDDKKEKKFNFIKNCWE